MVTPGRLPRKHTRISVDGCRACSGVIPEHWPRRLRLSPGDVHAGLERYLRSPSCTETRGSSDSSCCSRRCFRGSWPSCGLPHARDGPPCFLRRREHSRPRPANSGGSAAGRVSNRVVPNHRLFRGSFLNTGDVCAALRAFTIGSPVPSTKRSNSSSSPGWTRARKARTITTPSVPVVGAGRASPGRRSRPRSRSRCPPARAAGRSPRQGSHDVGDDHWKIAVVQSPPWSRTSCARAGPSGRSEKSTKKSGSISMPPFGSQSSRKSQERSSG